MLTPESSRRIKVMFPATLSTPKLQVFGAIVFYGNVFWRGCTAGLTKMYIRPCDNHPVYVKKCIHCQNNGFALKLKRKAKREEKQRTMVQCQAFLKHERGLEVRIVGTKTAVKSGFVYAVSNPAWPGWYKIGSAISFEERLMSYQTSDPHRSYSISALKYVQDRLLSEKKILEELGKKFPRQGEWIQVSLDKLKSRLSLLS